MNEGLMAASIIVLVFVTFWALVFPEELKEALLYKVDNTLMSTLLWVYIITGVLCFIYAV